MIMRLVMADGDLTMMILTATLNCSRATALTTTVQYENPEVDAASDMHLQDEADTDKRMDELNQAEQLISLLMAHSYLFRQEIYTTCWMMIQQVSYFYYCSLNIDWVYADVNAK